VTVAIDSLDVSEGGDSEDDFELRSLASLCDVRVSGQSELDRLLEGFEKTPLAALAFVQLLRSASTTSIHSGLLAESFVYSTLQAGPEFGRWRSSRRKKWKRKQNSEAACRIERDRGVLEIYLSRPDKHNAFSREMRDSLCEALQLALADVSIEEVILRGEGASFCSGGDLDEFGSMPDPAQAHVIRTTRSPALLISQLAGRIRTEVQGACIGAGVELPAFTGRVVAEEDAYFELPEVALGLIPGAGGTVSLPRRIGRQRTAWFGLSGERIDARTALDWGLVDEVRLVQHLES
jgi:enoyl-CoA hydratase